MSQERADALREAFATRVVVADGAMGTMLQAQEPTLEDFQQLEGCNEVLNVTRPDIVRSVHEAYFAAGVDCVETNTFGANHSALAEYEIVERNFELSEAGARVAREVADRFTAETGRQRWVLGSMGPGTKLPTLGHIPYGTLRDAYQTNAEGLISGGADALLVETTQDLLQTKASVIGARRAMEALGVDVPLICSVTVETTGTMLLGSEIGAALTSLEPLGIDMIGLNCATGPAEMSEHLRYLARNARIPLSCMPNAGLPVLTKEGAHYPLTAPELADAQETFVREYGLSLVGGCCGTTPEHLRQVVERVRGLAPVAREPRPEPGASSLYQTVPFRQDTSYMAIGERT
ncbi:homocysteine S-methyltransferase family protein, partial [Streptomyces sp. NPDC004244]